MAILFRKYRNIRMAFSLPILRLTAIILSLTIPSKFVIAEAGVALPKKPEWLPGKIKRDVDGRLYLSPPDAINSKATTNKPNRATEPTQAKPKILYKNWVILSWSPPKTNVDGSTLEDLSGYKIYSWTNKDSHEKMRDVKNVLDYKIDNLNYGETYFFAITSYSRKNIESSFSKVVSVKLKKPVI